MYHLSRPQAARSCAGISVLQILHLADVVIQTFAEYLQNC